MSAELLALNESGLSYAEIAQRVGMTRSAVAGAIYRYRARYGKPVGDFDNPALVRMAVDLADEVGPSEASRRLGIHKNEISLWRTILRRMAA